MSKKTGIIRVVPDRITTLPDGRGTYRVVRGQRNDAGPMLPQANGFRPMQTSEMITGTPLNRAAAFNVKTLPIAVVFGVAFWVIGGGLMARYPLLSLSAIAFLIAGFVLVWFAAWLIDALMSPSGIALLDALHFHRYVDREQEARLEQMRKDFEQR